MIHSIKNKEDVSKITVITVNYNVASNVNKLVDSLLLIDDIVDEIIIVDNNSTDSNKIKNNSKTKIIYNKNNVGFSRAVNIGIRLSNNNYILLINPDSYLENSSVKNSIKLITSNATIGVIGGKIKKPHSTEYQPTANRKANFLTGLFEFTNLKRMYPNNKFSQHFWVRTTVDRQPITVESLCGAYMIIRKKLRNKLNLFDERYFLYLEDVDFGNKVNSLGYKVVFDPNSEITHVGGKSSNSKYNIVLNEWYISRKIYFKKHLNIFESSILNLIFSIEEVALYILKK